MPLGSKVPVVFSELEEISLSSLSDKQILIYNIFTGNWENKDFPIITNILTTSDLPEGLNLYYTDARSRNSISASFPLSYNSSSGSLSLEIIPISKGGTRSNRF